MTEYKHSLFFSVASTIALFTVLLCMVLIGIAYATFELFKTATKRLRSEWRKGGWFIRGRAAS